MNKTNDKEVNAQRHKIMVTVKCSKCNHKKMWLYNNKEILKCPICKNEYKVKREDDKISIGE